MNLPTDVDHLLNLTALKTGFTDALYGCDMVLGGMLIDYGKDWIIQSVNVGGTMQRVITLTVENAAFLVKFAMVYVGNFEHQMEGVKTLVFH